MRDRASGAVKAFCGSNRQLYMLYYGNDL